MQRAVEADVAQVELDDAVEGSHRLGLELFEHAGGDPLVTPSSQRGVGHPMVQDRFDVDPGGAGDEPDEDRPQAQPVRDPGSVATEWVGPVRWRDSGAA